VLKVDKVHKGLKEDKDPKDQLELKVPKVSKV
jgi:hypothetical protein